MMPEWWSGQVKNSNQNFRLTSIVDLPRQFALCNTSSDVFEDFWRSAGKTSAREPYLSRVIQNWMGTILCPNIEEEEYCPLCNLRHCQFEQGSYNWVALLE